MKTNSFSVRFVRRLFLFVLPFIFVAHTTVSQTLSYSVFSDKHELLGNLKVSKTVTDTITQIEVVSEIRVTILFSFDVKYTLTSIYHNNELYDNSIITTKNDALYSMAHTYKVGKNYRFIKDGEEAVYSKRINFSEALLYFHEPVSLTSLYSEFDGFEKSIIKSAPNHYKIKNPVNGKISEYFYKNGTLESAVTHSQMIVLQIIRN